MQLWERQLERRVIYEGKILDLFVDTVALPNGHQTTREVVRHPGGACIAPLCENGDILLVRQYRYPFSQVLLELPAGKLSPGEDPEVCAIRELREETGMAAGQIRSMGCIYPSPAFLGEVIHLFAATELTGGPQQLDEDELLEVVRMPLCEALALVDEGRIVDAKSVALLLRIDRLRQQGGV